VLATCVIVAIICVFGATNPVMLPDIAGQKCILTAEIADIATKKVGGTAQIVIEEGNSGDESDSVCLIGKNTGDSTISGMKWLIDSGASAHMTSCKDAMECYKSIPTPSISIGDETKLQIIETGNVKMAIMVDIKVMKCTIKNVLHVPSLGYNLLSVGAMESKGMTASFGGAFVRYLLLRRKLRKEHGLEILACWMLLLKLVL
jgi:hypothetical protein